MSATRRRSAIPASPAGTLVSKIYVPLLAAPYGFRNDDRAGPLHEYPTAIRIHVTRLVWPRTIASRIDFPTPPPIDDEAHPPNELLG